jgi:hypothetical protein
MAILPLWIRVCCLHLRCPQFKRPSYARSVLPTIVEPWILIPLLALEAGDTFDDLVRKLRNRHVLWLSKKLRPVFCTPDFTGFRGSDIVPYTEATLFLQVDVDLSA